MSKVHDDTDELVEDDGLAADLATGLAEMTEVGEVEVEADSEPEVEAAATEPEPEVDDIGAELRAELEAMAAAADQALPEADDESTWTREQRRLADDALRRHGIDPSRRHEMGISRREAVRRLFRAEERLAGDPINGLAALARDYAGAGAPEQRAHAARAVLASLGFGGLGELAQQDAQRLQAYDRQHNQLRTEFVGKLREAASAVEAFRAQAPHLDQLRSTMAALLQTGEVSDLKSAYSAACKLRGLETPEDANRAKAQQQAEQRRGHAAKADRAKTPRTAGVSEEPAKDQPLAADLRDAYRELIGAR